MSVGFIEALIILDEEYFKRKSMSDNFWTDDKVADFAREYMAKCVANMDKPFNTKKSIEEFKKQEQQSKRDWVVEVFSDSQRNWVRQNDGKYKRSDNGEIVDYGEDYMIKYKYQIHSIKRLRDGEVFSVGDELSNEDGVIKRIIIDEKWAVDTCLFSTTNTYVLLGAAKKVEKPKPLLFKTLDGKEIYNGDKYWWVCEDDDIVCFDADAEWTARNKDGGFSTKEAAEDWLLMNKDLLSLNEVVLAMQNNTISCRKCGTHIHGTNAKNQLKQLAKDKLNAK